MSLFDPAGPVGYALLLLRTRIDRAKEADDLGASAVEWAIITAIVVVLAGVVAVAVRARVQRAINDITNG